MEDSACTIYLNSSGVNVQILCCQFMMIRNQKKLQNQWDNIQLKPTDEAGDIHSTITITQLQNPSTCRWNITTDISLGVLNDELRVIWNRRIRWLHMLLTFGTEHVCIYYPGEDDVDLKAFDEQTVSFLRNSFSLRLISHVSPAAFLWAERHPRPRTGIDLCRSERRLC